MTKTVQAYTDAEPQNWTTRLGVIRQNGNTLYAHWMYPTVGISISGASRIPAVFTCSASGAELPKEKAWWGNSEQGFLCERQKSHYMTFELPDRMIP